MGRLLESSSNDLAANVSRPAQSAPALPAVLWRRRYLLIGCVTAGLAMALIYLYFATRIYSATAQVIVEQNAPQALQEARQSSSLDDEGFIQTQSEVVQSLPVLKRALAACGPRISRTLATAGKDPIEWLRSGHGLKVELAKKSDVILVSMESPYPQESVDFANAVVDAYIAEQTQRGQATSDGMLKVLQKEKADKEKERDDLVAAMAKYRRDNGILQVDDSKGNTIMDRASTLSTSLTATELSVMQFKAEMEATQAALKDPASTAAFVESEQEKDRNLGDQELNDLRNERMQYEVALNSSTIIQGSKHQHVQILEATLETINGRIEQKEHAMGEGLLASAQARFAAAQEQEKEIRDALSRQTVTALGLSPESFANSQADVARIQRSLDTLDSRITELSVNKTTDAGPLTISLLEPASLEERPVKPNKLLVLGAALLVSLFGGMGVAIAMENLDLRLRSPEEVRSLLSIRVVAAVPAIVGDFSAVARGQIVRLDPRSAVSEAYRSIRTALHLGSNLVCKTLLFVSPTSGEGKSTTASNVALAFAQAGERTLLIDCDLREPVQHLIFEMDGSTGLSDVVLGSARLRDAVRKTDVPGLFILPCGPIPTNPSELLASKRFNRLMQALSKTFDRIIIDSPPLMNVTDGCILAAAADVTLLVLRMDAATRETAVLALEELERSGANVLGVVANGVQTRRAYGYYGTASTYVTHANRRLSFNHGTANNGSNGNGTNGNGANGNGSIGNGSNGNGRRAKPIDADMPLIEEPEWATD